MDSIIIKNMEIFANHGVHKEENVLGQKFIISAELFLDNRRAGISDNLEYSVDYGDICLKIEKITKNNTFRLIERLAEEIARQMLISYDRIKKASIEVCKPSAPLNFHMETVGVRAERKKSRAYIGIGSNMGDKKKHIDESICEIDSNEYCRVKKTADYIVTEPYGYINQDKFLNTAIEIETIMSPYELLEFLNETEKKHGRTRDIHWGPRTLDLDILLFDDLVIYDKKLCIPHIELCAREFVLEPLSRIAPYYVHPLKRKTIADLYSELISKKNKE